MDSLQPFAGIRAKLALPVVVAPMFLVSGPDLVLAACRSGVIGAFPAPNARSIEILDDWMGRIARDLASAQRVGPDAGVAPWAQNLVMHSTYDRLRAELDLVARHRPPIVITALGSPRAALEVVHGYGGLVIADVNSVEHARKAAATGVDGLALVCAGAGGHTGRMSAFAFIPAVREFFDGIVIVAGGISDGRGMGAGGCSVPTQYMGTRFIAAESPPRRYSAWSSGDLERSEQLVQRRDAYYAPEHRARVTTASLQPKPGMDLLDHRPDQGRKDVWSAGGASVWCIR